MKTLMAALAFLLLCACGGGGGSSPPAALASKTTAPAPMQTCASLLVSGSPTSPKCHVTVALIGDSKLWSVDVDNTSNLVQNPGTGGGLVGQASPSMLQLLQNWADVTYGPGVVGFIQNSVPGASFVTDLNGTPPSTAPLATRLAEAPVHYDIVATNFLTNDQYAGESLSQYQQHCLDWIGTVVQYGAIPIFLEPGPLSSNRTIALGTGPYPTYVAQITATNQFAVTVDAAFQNAGYLAVGNLTEMENYTSPPNAQPWNVLFMSSDEVHENNAGYAFDANNYFNGAANALGITSSLKTAINGVLAGVSP